LHGNKVPKNWKEKCFSFQKVENLNLDAWVEKLKDRFTHIRKWFQDSYLDVYNVSYLFNLRLFIYAVNFFFTKKSGISPENIKLKFFMTKFFSKEELSLDEISLKEQSLLCKGRDIIYCNGFVLENAFLKIEDLCLVDEKDPNSKVLFEQLPLIGITYEVIGEDANVPEVEEKEEEDEEEEIVEKYKIIHVNIYDRENPLLFENIENLGSLELNYDASNKEEYWISKAVKISLDI
jgi:hypothetical protein